LSIPSAPIVIVTDNCGNSDLEASPYSGTLLWNTGATTNSITVTTAGTYTVTQTINGCTSPVGSGTAAPLTIPSAPIVSVIDNCGNSVLTASSYTGSLLWNTAATTNSITVTSAGTYSVTQTVGSCTSITGTGIAAPKTIPVVSLGNDTALCINQFVILDAGNSGSTYLWTPGGQTSQTITVDSSGIGIGAHTYSVVVTNPDLCTASDNIVVIFNPCTGIETVTSDISFSVIPNPSNGMFYLTIEGLNESSSLNIFSMSGQIIYSDQLDNSGFVNKPIDLSSYAKGMYFIRVISKNYSHVEKIIIN